MSTLTLVLTQLAARPVGLCRRLHNRLGAVHRRWLLKDLRAQLDRLELSMGIATDQAIDNARHNRRDPALQAHRTALRREHEEKARRWLTVRRELDTLEPGL